MRSSKRYTAFLWSPTFLLWPAFLMALINCCPEGGLSPHSRLPISWLSKGSKGLLIRIDGRWCNKEWAGLLLSLPSIELYQRLLCPLQFAITKRTDSDVESGPHLCSTPAAKTDGSTGQTSNFSSYFLHTINKSTVFCSNKMALLQQKRH